MSDIEALLTDLVVSSRILADQGICDACGDTNLLISNNEMGKDFAAKLGGRRAAVMRGHGSTVVDRTWRYCAPRSGVAADGSGT